MSDYDFRKSDMNDVVLHVKTKSESDANGNQNYVFPVTRYENVMGRPKVTSELTSVFGSPFVFFSEGEITITDEEYNRAFGHIQ